jgi:hypothetical protein
MQVESAVSQPSLTETVSGREEEGHVYTQAGANSTCIVVIYCERNFKCYVGV